MRCAASQPPELSAGAAPPPVRTLPFTYPPVTPLSPSALHPPPPRRDPIGAVKVPQPHAWLYALRHRPLAAVGGAIVAGIVAAATGILTGFALWSDWLAQLRLANDPAWDVGGIALSRYLPEGIGFAIVVIC